jgi:membrane dipeptidase
MKGAWNSESAESIHQHAFVLDAHADIEIPGQESRYAGADGLSQVAPAKMRAGGGDAVVMAIAVGPGPRNEAGYALARKQADEELASIPASSRDAGRRSRSRSWDGTASTCCTPAT